MKATEYGHTAVVELLLSKGANIEAANNLMISNYWLEFLGSNFLDFEDYRDKIITIFMNIQIIRSSEMEYFSRLLLALYMPKYNVNGVKDKSPSDGRTGAWMCSDLFQCVRLSVCLVLFFATADIYFIYLYIHIFIYVLLLVGLHFRCFCSFRFIYLMIFGWKLPECAVSWTLYFH